MSFPTPGAYQEALQFPETAFFDPELRAGAPAVNALGLPQPITGAFAAVFPVDTPGGRYAVRCFLTDVPDQQVRYAAVARHLDQHPLSCMVAYEYLRQGIQVEGTTYPVLKMAWVEGIPLNRYIEGVLGRPELLRDLERAWMELVRDLAEAGIAHGDLQHGNVLVETTAENRPPRLRLVDYDTLYVPALAGRESPELGHRNYQHPDRSRTDFGPALDHFSALVMLTAIRACAAEPDLWRAHDTGENLLFQAGDFYHPDASELFARLYALPDVEPLARALRTACYREPLAAPALTEIATGREDGMRRHGQEPPTDRRPNSTRTDRRAGKGGVGIRFVVWTGLALLGCAFIASGSARVGLGLLALLAAGLVMLTFHKYRKSPSLQRRTRLNREGAFIERRIADLRRELAGIQSDRAALYESRETLMAQRLSELRDERLRERLKFHFIGELEAVQGVSHKAVIRLKTNGIRTAYHLTPERLDRVTGLDPAVRAVIATWRAALLRKYEPELPTRLSASEVQRLDRYLKRRSDEFTAEEARLDARLDVQEDERRSVEERKRETPEVIFRHTLLEVLGLVGERKASEGQTAPRVYLRSEGEGSRRAQAEVEAETASD